MNIQSIQIVYEAHVETSDKVAQKKIDEQTLNPTPFLSLYSMFGKHIFLR